ncbi:Hypothetical protein, putative [Bodo saltans]|uniref:Uncharacterized protein n=1 Tax=Bodo saltans TaxID=75058 RepID=A0A0S4JM23_BODSA|nr:Hypothetical protein, putative [Bodo saltans]|eukprot:CUG92567.1 Hypothetical protein, putative [Bodo saltans]
MRVRVVSACGAHPSIQRFFSNMFSATLPRLCASVKPVYYNPRTWPKHWAASDIQNLLEGHLLNPSDAPKIYESLKIFLNSSHLDSDLMSLHILVRHTIKPPPRSEVDVERYLRKHLDPNCDNVEMRLQERAPQLEKASA